MLKFIICLCLSVSIVKCTVDESCSGTKRLKICDGIYSENNKE